MNSLTKEQIEECKEIFKFLDINNDNYLDLEELFSKDNEIGLTFDDEEKEAIILRFGKIEGFSLDFEGFLEFYKDCWLAHQTSRELAEQMFADYDLNGDKVLDFNDLKYMLIRQGEIISPEEINALLRDYDVNGDGKLNLEEFLESIYG